MGARTAGRLGRYAVTSVPAVALGAALGAIATGLAPARQRVSSPVTPPSLERARTAPPAEDPSKPEIHEMHGATWRYALRRVWRGYNADHCTDLAASLVFFSVLAVFPALLAVVSVLGLLGQPQAVTDAISQLVGGTQSVDATVHEVIRSVVMSLSSPAAPVAFTGGVLVAVWSASKYVSAFSRAMNRIFDTDEGRPAWKRKPVQLLMTVAGLVLVLLAVVLVGLTRSVASTVGRAVGLSATVVDVFGVLKWPVVALIAVAVITMLYRFAPNVRQPRLRWTAAGSVIALLLLLAASAALGFAVSHFSHFSSTYGSLAGVIIGLVWLWLANLALLFGAEVNAEVERARELQAGIPAVQTIQLPPHGVDASEDLAATRAEDVRRGERLRATRGRSA